MNDGNLVVRHWPIRVVTISTHSAPHWKATSPFAVVRLILLICFFFFFLRHSDTIGIMIATNLQLTRRVLKQPANERKGEAKG